MIPKSTLKEIILDNEDYILNRTGLIISRKGLSSPRNLKKVVVIYGSRRSGKTYELFELFRNNRDCSLYIDFEDERLENFQTGDLERLRESFFELNPHLLNKKVIFLLDEVQNVSGWEKFSRRLVEKENISVYATGSSSKIMPSEIHTSLRGRSWGIELLPFSYREYLKARGFDPSDKKMIYGKENAIAKKELMSFLKWGGFPEISLLKSEMEKGKVISEYLNAMFFKDLAERYEITNIHLLDAMMDKFFSSSAQKFSLAAFYKQYKGRFPFSKDLLYGYYKHFLESMLVFEVRKFSNSTYKRFRNPPKIYLVDTGLAKRITSLDIGRLLENAVYLELRRRGCEMFYHEEKNECDFIIKNPGGRLSCAQVTFEMTKVNRDREINGLIEACKALKINKGTIFTSDDEDQFKTKGIKVDVTPFWKWALTLSPPLN